MSRDLRLPSWVGPPLFGALLSGIMSFLVAGVATVKAMGLSPALAEQWFSAWLSAWPVAFVAVLIIAPIVRRLVAAVVAPANVRSLSDAAERVGHSGTR